MKMNLDYSNVCRLCAKSCKNFVLIFEKTSLVNFAEKIKSYLHVEIENSKDAFEEPRMCGDCYERLIVWDQYAEEVKKVQGMFMSLTSDRLKDEDARETVPGEKEYDHINSTGETSTKETESGNQLVQVRRESDRKRKQRSGKKGKKVRERSESEFSDDDNIPLSSHLDVERKSVTSKSKQKQRKKVKLKIKLKIKPIQKVDTDKGQNEREEEPAMRNDCPNDTGAMSSRDGEQGEEEEEVETENGNENEVDDGGGGGYEDDDDDDGCGGGSNGEDNGRGGSEGKKSKGESDSGFQSLFTWECLECQAPVKNWNALVKHCKETHGSHASVQCVCGKFLQSRASITKHRMKHTNGYGYKCEFKNCNKTFHRQQLLDVHFLSHMPKELQPWMCCKCSRRFHTESLLKQHERVHLPKEEKLIHPCEVCQKKFCSKSAVTAHVRAVHFGERPFVCDQCGHSFTSKGILHEHLTIHSDVYNFHCKDCNKSFKTKYRLKIHMDTHMETRYQCPICTLTLNTRRTLRMHLLVHRDDKAFQCTTCGKAFKRSKDLKNHYNLHTGRRPYTCPFCQRTFANGSNCRSHKRRMHPEELKMYEEALAAGQDPASILNGPADGGRTTEKTQDDSNDSKSDDDGKGIVGQVTTEVDMTPDNVQTGTNMVTALNLRKDTQEEPMKGTSDESSREVPASENIVTNITQISFTNQLPDSQYPVQNFYTFQSVGIPAFPGNSSFFRQ